MKRNYLPTDFELILSLVRCFSCKDLLILRADTELDFIQLAPVERYEKSEKSDNWSEGMAHFGFHYKTVTSEKGE